MTDMEEIILWGTGKIANRLIETISGRIVLVVDNDKEKWGVIWNGYRISSPDAIRDTKFDKIIIAAVEWRVIRKQIGERYHIDQKMIENMYYLHKKILLQKYERITCSDKADYISYLKQNPLDVFNDDFVDQYLDFDIEVHWDANCSLYYVYHNNKRMYLSRAFSTEEQVKIYYRSLCIEQDISSPHRYQIGSFCVSKGDVVLDVGAAEGNFALDVIDMVDKIYLIESDEKWIEALMYTFAPFMDKVELLHGFAGKDEPEEIAIDSIPNINKIDFIKMDIEGSEVKALMGATRILKENDVRLDVCAYHNLGDEKKIKRFLDELGYQTETSEGYMVFIPSRLYEKNDSDLEFTRGLVRGYKER